MRRYYTKAGMITGTKCEDFSLDVVGNQKNKKEKVSPTDGFSLLLLAIDFLENLYSYSLYFG